MRFSPEGGYRSTESVHSVGREQEAVQSTESGEASPEDPIIEQDLDEFVSLVVWAKLDEALALKESLGLDDNLLSSPRLQEAAKLGFLRALSFNGSVDRAFAIKEAFGLDDDVLRDPDVLSVAGYVGVIQNLQRGDLDGALAAKERLQLPDAIVREELENSILTDFGFVSVVNLTMDKEKLDKLKELFGLSEQAEAAIRLWAKGFYRKALYALDYRTLDKLRTDYSITREEELEMMNALILELLESSLRSPGWVDIDIVHQALDIGRNLERHYPGLRMTLELEVLASKLIEYRQSSVGLFSTNELRNMWKSLMIDEARAGARKATNVISSTSPTSV